MKSVNYSAYIGLDVHKDTIAVAVANPERQGEVRFYGNISSAKDSVIRLMKKLIKLHGSILVCYEAGPIGYGLYRLLLSMNIDCTVVAPSRIPKISTNKIKNDHRDAVALARLLRAGELVDVWVPDMTHEAMRDLVRARSCAKKDTKVAKQRIQSILLRTGKRYEKKMWTVRHRVWLANQSFPIAISVVAELGDFSRFSNPKQIMAFLGLIPGEYSSGSTTLKFGITKAGNVELRRLLYEATWAYRNNAKVGNWLVTYRPDSVCQEAKDISWKAQQRLCFRYRSLVAKGKKSQVAITAVERELLGFMWDIAVSTRSQKA
ncbi:MULTISPECIES: IS110 family transposase [Vibrio harveyi group]|uniref:IS110 family transposase n=1 Tax=Vibrio harveyi group TaxID=717610 RepID=UPI001BD48B9E|nr:MULTISPECIES: transposase [Vibrio harveyi group]EGQ8195181.1 IS110 family transposase [Vibrio parahaemolyticus]MBS9834967.1 transposase [Vibrio alginolyticus]WHT05003.1 transposase [Vibrio parahaemolyticus]